MYENGQQPDTDGVPAAKTGEEEEEEGDGWSYDPQSRRRGGGRYRRRFRSRHRSPARASQTEGHTLGDTLVLAGVVGIGGWTAYYLFTSAASGEFGTYGEGGDSDAVRRRDTSESGGIPVDGTATAKRDAKIPPPIGQESVNRLPVQFSIVVPSTRGAEPISQAEFEQRVEDARVWMSGQFGGDTTIHASGGYVGEEGNLIDEDVATVEASMSVESYMENRRALADFIQRMRDEWEQDTVAYSVEGHLYIYPERDYIDDDEALPRRVDVT